MSQIQNVLDELKGVTAELKEIQKLDAQLQAKMPMWRSGVFSPEIDGIVLLLYNDEYRTLMIKDGICSNAVIAKVWKDTPLKYYVVPPFVEDAVAVNISSTTQTKTQISVSTTQAQTEKPKGSKLTGAKLKNEIKMRLARGESYGFISKVLGITTSIVSWTRNSLVINGELGTKAMQDDFVLNAITYILKNRGNKKQLKGALNISSDDWGAFCGLVKNILPDVLDKGSDDWNTLNELLELGL